MITNDNVLVEVENLQVAYKRENKPDVQAVQGVSFTIKEGETVGIVGESGCGKSTLAKALIRGLPSNGEITNGHIYFDGKDLASMSMKEVKSHRWWDISMIAQGAMASLDPVYTIGTQINEAIQTHEDGVSKTEGFERARELLTFVGIDPETVDNYPHQLSGGMRQRAIIAMSLALNPRLIIADEPTTALDVIVQKQILSNIREMQDENNSSMLMVTHDISVVAETCDKVIVMYGGKIMEIGTVEEIFNDAYHPYTLGLQNAFPSIDGDVEELVSIPGTPPDLANPVEGCPFKDRCPYSDPVCNEPLPARELSENHLVHCHEPVPFEEVRRTASERGMWHEKEDPSHTEVKNE